ncbi:unnamed protein product [Meloidogyne enterolobii]|uniref:Uncharacterized protein n=1 Tax=Meloidogyne enterolobii TaxID=390850 RepID=A0ACB1ATD6_MELEN
MAGLVQIIFIVINDILFSVNTIFIIIYIKMIVKNILIFISNIISTSTTIA